MGEKYFMTFHKITEDMRPEPFTKEFIQDTVDGYSETCKPLGCVAMGVFSAFTERENFCITKAESADQVREAHEPGIPRDSIQRILEVEFMQPQGAPELVPIDSSASAPSTNELAPAA